MKRFSDIRESTAANPVSARSKILSRGGKKEEKEDLRAKAESVEEMEATSIIDILRQLHEDAAGRIVVVQEGADNKEVYVDFETANYLLGVYEELTPENQSTFENTLIENIENLDEIALYCETVIENQDETH